MPRAVDLGEAVVFSLGDEVGGPRNKVANFLIVGGQFGPLGELGPRPGANACWELGEEDVCEEAVPEAHYLSSVVDDLDGVRIRQKAPPTEAVPGCRVVGPTRCRRGFVGVAVSASTRAPLCGGVARDYVDSAFEIRMQVRLEEAPPLTLMPFQEEMMTHRVEAEPHELPSDAGPTAMTDGEVFGLGRQPLRKLLRRSRWSRHLKQDRRRFVTRRQLTDPPILPYHVVRQWNLHDRHGGHVPPLPRRERRRRVRCFFHDLVTNAVDALFTLALGGGLLELLRREHGHRQRPSTFPALPHLTIGHRQYLPFPELSALRPVHKLLTMGMSEGDSRAEEVVKTRLESLVTDLGRVNANCLGERYRLAFGEGLDYKGLGYKKLGSLLDSEDGSRWRVDRVKTGGRGAMFVAALDNDDDHESGDVADDMVVLGFYHYCSPRWSDEARDATAAWLHSAVTARGLRGRVRVACEGVNVSLTGPRKNAAAFVADLVAGHDDWRTVDFKTEPCTPSSAWRRLRVWTADELCGLGCDPEVQRRLDDVGPGDRLEPKTFHDALTSPKKKTALIDCRNVYETAVGRFEGSDKLDHIDPQTRHFADFPTWVDDHRDHLAQYDAIYMYCTGGVRCERASALLKARLDADDTTQRPPEIFHLHGGIVRYTQTFDKDASLFKGKNYIFDRRARGDDDGHPAATDDILGHCILCRRTWDSYRGKRRCASCHTLVLVCEPCLSTGADKSAVLSCPPCETQRRFDKSGPS